VVAGGDPNSRNSIRQKPSIDGMMSTFLNSDPFDSNPEIGPLCPFLCIEIFPAEKNVDYKF